MTAASVAHALPILTLPDPKTEGEGALDPLGLSTLADHLADRILPGMAARMSRPRFLTAIAVSAALREHHDFPEAPSGIPAEIAFEWLVVEAFVRRRPSDASSRRQYLRTPGIDKVERAVAAGASVGPKNYLKTPGVFGFHGVYKRLARFLHLVDDEGRMLQHGSELVRCWEDEQNVPREWKDIFGEAVQASIVAGVSRRSEGWRGWVLLADYLAPGAMGKREAQFLRDSLCDDDGPSSEVFRILSKLQPAATVGDQRGERGIFQTLLRAHASNRLLPLFKAVDAYEDFANTLEEAFDWLCWLASDARGSALSSAEFSRKVRIKELTDILPQRIEAASGALELIDPRLKHEFDSIADSFVKVTQPQDLYTALRGRHSAVQRAKPPDGKREWFEYGNDDSLFIRPLYRLDSEPEPLDAWRRPYRLHAVRSFCIDFNQVLRR